MKFTPEEQLSALLDGELPEIETELVVRRSLREESLRRTAIRYCLIGDAMRDELPHCGPVDLVSRVRSGLETDPGPAPVLSEPQRRPWPRLVAGLAVAASVALVAVLAVPGGGHRPDPAPLSASQVAAPAAGPVYTVPPAYTRQAAGGPDRLTRYYINHSEYSTLMGGRSALSRIVARTPSADGEYPAVRVEKVNAPR